MSTLIGLLSVSDRAKAGVYEDRGIPALRTWLKKTLSSPWRDDARVVADDYATITQTLREMIDDASCQLVLTTGGTG
jgi:molybdopterin adenylyltransferase